ncbi:energy transducer TonB [Telmatobacter sp. DSM 110680]|uniref:Energy transducer TonB n=1 Tax=Telmatobacter sp. DSM 110680 TaxID=3036704 RepID=A0AAU7DGF1_9BACT
MLLFFLASILLSTAPAQVVAPMPTRVQVSSNVANTFLIHKQEPGCQKDSSGVKVTGTVVIEITIDTSGKAIHTHTLSGPKLLRPVAVTAVRKYRYKPYLLNGTPVEVVTPVSIQMHCRFHSGQA